jgi:hypothetical protein
MSDTDTDTAVQDAQDEFYLYNVEGKTVVTGELDTVDLTTKKTTVSDEEVFDEIFDIFMSE